MEDETPKNPEPDPTPPPVEPTPAQPEPQPQPQAESQSQAPEAPPSPGFLDQMGVLFSKYPQVTPPGKGEMAVQDEKMWAMICHLGGLVCTSFGLGFVAPLVIYMMQKDKSPFVATHAREALNFHLSFLILAMACLVLAWLVIPVLVLMAGSVVMLVAAIVASIKAYDGDFMALPFTFRMIK